MFICNHCPYVLAIATKLVGRAGAALQALGFGVAAICSNDATTHPADSFEPTWGRSRAATASAFPTCTTPTRRWRGPAAPSAPRTSSATTPTLELQYRGRLDASGRSADPAARRELYEAMALIARTGRGPRDQVPSIGCTIKWKAA